MSGPDGVPSLRIRRRFFRSAALRPIRDPSVAVTQHVRVRRRSGSELRYQPDLWSQRTGDTPKRTCVVAASDTLVNVAEISCDTAVAHHEEHDARVGHVVRAPCDCLALEPWIRRFGRRLKSQQSRWPCADHTSLRTVRRPKRGPQALDFSAPARSSRRCCGSSRQLSRDIGPPGPGPASGEQGAGVRTESASLVG